MPRHWLGSAGLALQRAAGPQVGKVYSMPTAAGTGLDARAKAAESDAAAIAAAFAEDFFGPEEGGDSASQGGSTAASQQQQEGQSAPEGGSGSGSDGSSDGSSSDGSSSDGSIPSWKDYLQSERFATVTKVHVMVGACASLGFAAGRPAVLPRSRAPAGSCSLAPPAFAAPQAERRRPTALPLQVGENVQQTVIGPLLAALWAQCCCWDSPEDAVYLAIHLGGYSRTSAAMAGALAGGSVVLAEAGRQWCWRGRAPALQCCGPAQAGVLRGTSRRQSFPALLRRGAARQRLDPRQLVADDGERAGRQGRAGGAVQAPGAAGRAGVGSCGAAGAVEVRGTAGSSGGCSICYRASRAASGSIILGHEHSHAHVACLSAPASRVRT
jgi:hypothetical protein